MREDDPVSVGIRRRSVAVDAACAEAVEPARAAAAEVAGDPAQVAEWLGVEGDGERLATHRFAAALPAYRGWLWAVTVARAPRARQVTVAEVVLLPGAGALRAPEWVPWSDRVRPGDLGVGDLMVTAPDDERLVPAYASGDDPEEEAVAFELGLGRVRVLSLEGRDDAAERWLTGPGGPLAALAKAAPAPCGTCGFWVPVRGDLGQLFGACANEFAPDDGRMVAADHGCGAHSEAAVAAEEPVLPAEPLVDTVGYDLLGEPPADAEELGHS